MVNFEGTVGTPLNLQVWSCDAKDLQWILGEFLEATCTLLKVIYASAGSTRNY